MHDVFLCAPTAMTVELTTALRGAGVPLRNVHHESFEFAVSGPRRSRQAAAASLAVAGVAVVIASRCDFNGTRTAPVAASRLQSDGTTTGYTATHAVTSPAVRGRAGSVVVVGSLQHTLFTNVQVAAVLRHGRLVDVRALSLPNLDARSRQISAMAAPILRREAIAAGSAHIDAVSGATYTSAAYAQSLQAALDSRPSH
jgi:uncharacterized protein with FMN-binding domain